LKLLTFQASRFAWKSFSKTLPDASAEDVRGEVDEQVRDALVVFVHAERKDEDADERRGVFRKTLKHVKWLANKRDLKNVVLHSFAHLGGESSSPEFTRGFLDELAARLRDTGYDVRETPFGWFCSWELAVFGDSLAKVWKEL
jgi:hypothetical protein